MTTSNENQPEYPEQLGFLRTHISQIERHHESASPYASVTNEEQHHHGQMYFRDGYRTANSRTRKLFLVLRGLPGCGATAFAQGVISDAAKLNVRSMALLSTEDYFYDHEGTYIFDKALLPEYHRRNFRRACQYFTLDTELVILNNYNIKKSHYRHYVTIAQSMGYVIGTYTVGNPKPTDRELQVYAANTEGRVPANVIRTYAQIFEPDQLS